jgi:undecaprenyl-diphosphatase
MEFLKLLEAIRTPFFTRYFNIFTYFSAKRNLHGCRYGDFCASIKNGLTLLYVSFLGNIINYVSQAHIHSSPVPGCSIKTLRSSKARERKQRDILSQRTHAKFRGFVSRYRPLSKRSSGSHRLRCVDAIGAFSRMYLGVHTPPDVLVSLGVAFLLVFAAYPLLNRAWDNVKWFAPLVGVLLAVGIALILYIELVPMPANAIAEFSLSCNESGYKMVGGAVGFAAVLWLERKYINFSVKAVWWAQLLKLVLGLGVVVAVQSLTKAPLLALFGGHNAGNAVRYFLMVLVGGALWPMTFQFFGKLGQKKEQAA